MLHFIIFWNFLADCEWDKIVLESCMRPNLSNKTQGIFNKAIQATEAYHRNMEGQITSLETAMSQAVRRICAKTTELFHALR